LLFAQGNPEDTFGSSQMLLPGKLIQGPGAHPFREWRLHRAMYKKVGSHLHCSDMFSIFIRYHLYFPSPY
jgi:hypothetical protein